LFSFFVLFDAYYEMNYEVFLSNLLKSFDNSEHCCGCFC